MLNAIPFSIARQSCIWILFTVYSVRFWAFKNFIRCCLVFCSPHYHSSKFHYATKTSFEISIIHYSPPSGYSLYIFQLLIASYNKRAKNSTSVYSQTQLQILQHFVMGDRFRSTLDHLQGVFQIKFLLNVRFAKIQS